MTSNQSISDIADFFGAYTYKDDLIYFMAENIDDWRHRELALRKDPFIRAFVSKLNKELFFEKPIFTPDIFGGKEQTEEEGVPALNGDGNSIRLSNKPPLEATQEMDVLGQTEKPTHDVTQEWEQEKWTQLLIKMFNKTRIHRYSVVKLYDRKPYWRVYCDREITEIYYDDEDNPTGCKVEWSRSMPKSNKYFNYEETITFFDGDILTLEEGKNYGLLVQFGSAESDENLGELDIEDIWSLAIYIRYALLDVVQNSAKCSGFFWLMYGSAIDPTARQALLNALDLSGSGRAIGAGENILKQVTAMYPAHPEFSIEALGEFIRQFSMACRVPLTFFRSESEKGSLFGEQSGDEIKLNKQKMYIFSLFKTAIIALIKMRWGIEIEDVKPNLLAGEEEQITLQNNFNNQNTNNFNQKEEVKPFGRKLQ